MDTPPYLRSMRLLRNVMVPMRDGVRLATTVYLPLGEGPWPVALVRMAYNRTLFTGYGFADRGMALVVQDTRGRYASEGEFYPFVSETDDGLDTLDWLAQQPWCNGRVGMFGASYLGAVQFAVAPHNHPLVHALNPQFMSGDFWRHTYYCNGVFSLALVFSWLCFECGSRTSEASQLSQFDIAALLRELPLISIDEKSGAVSPYFRDYLERYADGPFWWSQRYTDALPRVRTPTLLTGGWYDNYPGETFRNYAALMRGDPDVRGKHRVIVGPWTHGFNQATRLGDVDFGPDSLKENDHATRWLTTLLTGGEPEAFQAAPIRIFVMGDNLWRDEREWPLARTRFTRYYLGSGGRANTAAGDGSLATAPPSGAAAADRYTYDPADPVPTLGGNHSVGPYNPGLYDICLPGPIDQRPTEARPDVLVYTGDPLEEDLELTGPIELRLFITSSAVDTDFVARLCDVHPDGRSINITEGVMRARFRGGGDKPELMRPGEVYELAIELEPTSNVFKRGHRLRLQVTSSNFPLWARNLNTGGHPAHETEIIVAEQTVLHDAARPSHLVLPVIPRG